MSKAVTMPKLDLSDAQAKKVVKLAIDNGAYSDEMPKDKKGRLEAAQEAIEFCVDSWVNDEVRPDDDDEEIAAAGEAILTIFEAAGIEVDDDNEIVFDAAEAEADEEDEEEEDEDAEEDDDEAPFDPDDYIPGYTELSVTSRINKLKQLDLDDDDTANVVNSIREWEEEQDKPASRVLNWIEENLGEAEDEGDEDAEDEAESDSDFEPYTKKELLKLDKDALRAIWDEWEMGDDFPKRFTDAGKQRVVAALLEAQESENGEADEPEEEADEQPRKALSKAKRAKSSDNGAIKVTLTREQIIEALTEGAIEIFAD